jgi:hypothetical protein
MVELRVFYPHQFPPIVYTQVVDHFVSVGFSPVNPANLDFESEQFLAVSDISSAQSPPEWGI